MQSGCQQVSGQNPARSVDGYRSESKGETPLKVSTATDELQYLMDFNSRVTQAVAKTMGHSVVFFKTCNKCPNFFHKFACWGETPTFF